jgi:condensin complex subunit 1
MASMFFMELSQKGNTLYNVMPDIISRLSTPDLKLEEEKFKTIMK